MVYNDACGPLRLALLSASVPASLACAVGGPRDARADIGDKNPDNSGQLPFQSVQFITAQPATGVVLLLLSPRPAQRSAMGNADARRARPHSALGVTVAHAVPAA